MSFLKLLVPASLIPKRLCDNPWMCLASLQLIESHWVLIFQHAFPMCGISPICFIKSKKLIQHACT